MQAGGSVIGREAELINKIDRRIQNILYASGWLARHLPKENHNRRNQVP